MNEWMNEWIKGLKNKWMNERIDEWMNKWMKEWTRDCQSIIKGDERMNERY